MSRDNDLQELLDAADILRKVRRDRQFQTDLELAERHIEDARIRVERQRDIVKQIRARGANAELAEALLTQFEDMLAVQVELLKTIIGRTV
jgi:uncharacterized protein YeeX (DUF496 family)